MKLKGIVTLCTLGLPLLAGVLWRRRGGRSYAKGALPGEAKSREAESI